MQTTTNRNSQFSISWWLVMLEGIIVFILGVLLAVNPEKTITALVGLLGTYLLVMGILRVIYWFLGDKHWGWELYLQVIGMLPDSSSQHRGKRWGWTLFSGIVAIIVALFIMTQRYFLGPITPIILAYAVAVVLLLDGLVHLAAIFRPQNTGSEWGSPLMGIFEFLFGLILLFVPYLTVAVIYVAVVTAAIVGGLVLFFYAFSLRRRNKTQPEEKPG